MVFTSPRSTLPPLNMDYPPYYDDEPFYLLGDRRYYWQRGLGTTEIEHNIYQLTLLVSANPTAPGQHRTRPYMELLDRNSPPLQFVIRVPAFEVESSHIDVFKTRPRCMLTVLFSLHENYTPFRSLRPASGFPHTTLIIRHLNAPAYGWKLTVPHPKALPALVTGIFSDLYHMLTELQQRELRLAVGEPYDPISDRGGAETPSTLEPSFTHEPPPSLSFRLRALWFKLSLKTYYLWKRLTHERHPTGTRTPSLPRASRASAAPRTKASHRAVISQR